MVYNRKVTRSIVHLNGSGKKTTTGEIMKKCIQYIRVSTTKQQATSLGLDAQQHAIARFAEMNGYEIVAKYQDVDSGGNDDRPALMEALELAKSQNIPVMVSKLCRLSRSVHFVSGLMAHNVPFVVCSLGQEVPPFLLHVVSALGEETRRQTAINTRNALQQAKRNGVKLGTHNQRVLDGVKAKGQRTLDRMWPHIQQAESEGITSISKTQQFLNQRNIKTTRGKAWTRGGVQKLLARIRKAEADGRLTRQMQLFS